MNKLDELIKYCNYVVEHGPEDIKDMFESMSFYLSRYKDISNNIFFYLNDTEQAEANKFIEKCVKGRYFGTIGGGVTYTFTPTGLGDIKTVETILDNGKKIHKDITDISHW